MTSPQRVKMLFRFTSIVVEIVEEAVDDDVVVAVEIDVEQRRGLQSCQ